MGQMIKKENLTIVIGTYTDRQSGQKKKQYRTIGELITMRGDDGSEYQFGKLWGPGGCTDFKVFEQRDLSQHMAQHSQTIQQPQNMGGMQTRQAMENPANPMSQTTQRSGSFHDFDDDIPF